MARLVFLTLAAFMFSSPLLCLGMDELADNPLATTFAFYVGVLTWPLGILFASRVFAKKTSRDDAQRDVRENGPARLARYRTTLAWMIGTLVVTFVGDQLVLAAVGKPTGSPSSAATLIGVLLGVGVVATLVSYVTTLAKLFDANAAVPSYHEIDDSPLISEEEHARVMLGLDDTASDDALDEEHAPAEQVQHQLSE